MEEENVKVVVRVRPMQTMEKKNGDIPCVKASDDGKEVQVKVGPLDAQVYKCNKCFPNDSTQALFFSESGITSLLDSAIEGYRACAFAFGQTGAGKSKYYAPNCPTITYTIQAKHSQWLDPQKVSTTEINKLE
jgi:hypothetical protein